MTAQLEGLRMLRHLVRAIQLDARTPSANGWEWGRLLQGVDESLHAFATRHTQTDKDGPARDERIARSAPAPAACAPHGLADEKWQIEQRVAWQKVQLQKGDVVVVNYNKKNLMANVLQVRAPVTRECWPADRLSIAPLTPFHSFRLSLAGAVRALLPRHRPVLRRCASGRRWPRSITWDGVRLTTTCTRSKICAGCTASAAGQARA